MASSTNLNVLNIKVKKAVCIISFKDRYEHTAPLFKDLQILPLDKSIEIKYGKFMWRLHNNYLPNSIIKNFRSNSRTNFSRSLSRLESLNKFVLFEGPQLWSQLPSDLIDKPSLNSFTKAYKKLLGYGYNHTNTNTNSNNNQNNVRRDSSSIDVLRRGRNNYGRLTNWTGDRMVRWDNNQS